MPPVRCEVSFCEIFQVVQESSQAAVAFNEKELILHLAGRLEEFHAIFLKTADDVVKLQRDMTVLQDEVSFYLRITNKMIRSFSDEVQQVV